MSSTALQIQFENTDSVNISIYSVNAIGSEYQVATISPKTSTLCTVYDGSPLLIKPSYHETASTTVAGYQVSRSGFVRLLSIERGGSNPG